MVMVLAYLALEGETPRARLAKLLWPDTPARGARNNLVHLLRRLSLLCGGTLVHGRAALTLDDGVFVDARTLLEPSEAPCDAPASRLLAGVDMDNLPEVEAWVEAWREVLDGRQRARLVHAAQVAEDQGDWTTALQVAGQLLDLNPVSEDALRRVMWLHVLSGDRPAALAAFARGRNVLARELGVEPEQQTRDMAGWIERGEALPGVRQSVTLPLGVLRPPVLVGRATAWAQLEAAWSAGQTIYLTGDAGVGKTRLAQEFVASHGRALYLPGGTARRTCPSRRQLTMRARASRRPRKRRCRIGRGENCHACYQNWQPASPLRPSIRRRHD